MAPEKQPRLLYLFIIVLGLGALLGVLLLCSGLLADFSLMAAVYPLAEVLDQEGVEVLFYTHSPEKTHLLEVARINPGALEPFYIRVSRIDGQEKRWVYNVRGQDEAEVLWLSENVAQINGVPVDVRTDYFHANARAYVDAVVLIDAGDAQAVRLTMYIGGELRAGQTSRQPWSRTADGDPQVILRLDALEELHWDDDLSALPAGLTCAVTGADGQTYTLPWLWEWTAEENGRYRFRLTGSAEEGYTLTPEHPCETTTFTEATE